LHSLSGNGSSPSRLQIDSIRSSSRSPTSISSGFGFAPCEDATGRPPVITGAANTVRAKNKTANKRNTNGCGIRPATVADASLGDRCGDTRCEIIRVLYPVVVIHMSLGCEPPISQQTKLQRNYNVLVYQGCNIAAQILITVSRRYPPCLNCDQTPG